MDNLAYCKVAVAPVRADHSDRAEIVTQLLFGEIVTVLEYHQQWMRVQSYADNYEGWIDGKQVHFLRLKEVNRWCDGLTVETALTRQVETPWGNQWITRGAFVPYDNSGAFSIGKDTFRFMDAPSEEPLTTVDLAKSYENAPYLWGGKTPFGIDCSALMQLSFRFFGINLPRDASQQVDMGMEIPFGEHQAGDLAFFLNADGRIHHVGLLLNTNEIIHASGWVRTDVFMSSGIVRRTENELSHTLACIRRL